MTQLLFKLGWMLCALSACSVHVGAVFRREDNAIEGYLDTCPDHFTGLLPYRYDCRRFLNCWKGRGHLQSCAPGTNFNAETLECDRPEKVVCMGNKRTASQQRSQPLQLAPLKQSAAREDRDTTSALEMRCPYDANGPHPHPSDCYKFLNCDHGKAHIMSCGPGTAFNPTTRVCDFPHNVNCGAVGAPNSIGAAPRFAPPTPQVKDNDERDDVIRCPPNASGLYAHPWNCAKFLNCAFGNLVEEHDCQPGSAFDAVHGSCDERVSCPDRVAPAFDQHGIDSGLIYMDQLPIPSNGPPVQTDIVCPPGVTGLYPYPFDKTKFLNCRDGRTSIQNCQRSYVFSIMKRFCDERHNIPTSDCVAFVVSELKYEYSLAVASCPPGTDGPHLYPYDETKYIYCRNGQLVVQQCSPGATYNTMNSECSASYRDPKSFSDGRDNNARFADYGNRWSNMNRTRPTSAISSGHSYVSREESIPGQQVIYEEGTLEPERNSVHTDRTYSTQLAPFAPMPPRANAYAPSPTLPTTSTPTPTKVYYAQPVGSQEDSREVFASNTPAYVRRQPWLPAPPNTRQNHSREFHQVAPSSSRWTPVAERPAAHDRFGEPDLQQTDPFDRLFNPDFTMPVTRLMPPPPPSSGGQSVHDSRQQPLDLGAYPSVGSADQYPSETQPMAANWLPAPNDHYRPSSHPAAVDSTPPRHVYGDGEAVQWQPGNTQPGASAFADESNLFGGLQPPPPMQQTTTPMPYRPHSPPWRQSSTRPTSNNVSTQWPNAPSHETDSKTRIYQIYPPVSNPREPQPPAPDPHYSPSYASVAHSRADTLDTGAAGRKVPPQHTLPPTYTSSDSAVGNVASRSGVWSDRGDHANPGSHDIDTPDFGLATTTEYRGATPPPYNRQYYQGNVKGGPRRNELVEGDDGGTMDELPISDAIRMLLRPYFNRSGTIGDDTAAQAESHIMNLMAEPVHEMASRTSATTSTTTTPQPVAAQEEDVELIFAGEQSSLAHLPTPPNTPDVDLRFGGSAHSGKRGHHSREYHRRHPNLPQPSTFAGDERSLSNPDTVHNHPHHPHHAHHPHEHSREFHMRHPNMRNPFATREGDHSIVDPIDEELPNPFAEPTTPNTLYGIDLRSSNSNNKPSENSCAFRCGRNGKCLQQSQLCDGVKDCDDRSDENDCDHLGYAIRLAGGETSNVGRIEIRVNGRWGYVCDDKFGLPDADVVCRELGFKQGANEVRGASYYPPDDTNIHYLMDQLECAGNETSLRDCDFSGWGINNCGPEEVAGVVCKVPLLKCPNDYWLCATSKECIPPAFVCDHTPDCADKSDESDEVCHAPIEYRLEGGRTPTEGRLEVKYRREWGTICDDDFGSKEAQVACNWMGFYGRATVRKNIYGQGNGPIWLDQVSCFGNETSLDQCHHFNWGEHNCNHTEDVSIECTVGSRPATRLNGVTQKSAVSAEPSTPETPGTPHEDIGLYPRQERQLAYLSNPLRRCGQYKTELADAHSHPEERVVNGTVAKRGRHPWQATIRTRGRGGISSHWCGAVLISKRHLLTAAHCLAGYPKGAYFVRMGDHYANIAESTEVDAFIENWYIHEKFRDQTHMNNDIAVIVLKQPVRFNDYIQPVCLPDKDAPLAENRMCTISGWGSIKSGVSTPSNILRSAQLPLIADSVCKQPHVYGPSMSEGMFCAGSMDESVDACDGDSGGPLVCSDEGGETLYGIISWGQHCGYANKPGVYVRVEKYIEWIYEKINYSLQRT